MPTKKISVKLYELTQVVNFCCRRQHISPGWQASSIQQAAATMVGIHAARLITPYFALRTRVASLQFQEIHDALHTSKFLIKARCMRGTLHLLPHDLFQIAHYSTLRKRLSVCNTLFNKHQMSRNIIDEIASVIIEIVKIRPLATTTITATVMAYLSRNSDEPALHLMPIKIRAVLKELWEQGTLCYVNKSEDFGTEDRHYGLTCNFYPEIIFSEMQFDVADVQLVERYIRCYAPATINDAVWWAGIEKRRVIAALAALGDQVQMINIKGFEENFLIHTDDVDSLNQTKVDCSDWVIFLAHEDPSLKGYYQSRGRYITTNSYPLLFNDIGESRPAIMLNGKVIGVWSFDRRTGQVHTNVFESISKKQMNLINEELRKITKDVANLLSGESGQK